MRTYPQAKTGARPRTVAGETFECWHVGILRYEWRNANGNLSVASNYKLTGYHAHVNGKYIMTGKKPKRFLTMATAMAAAVKESRRDQS